MMYYRCVPLCAALALGFGCGGSSGSSVIDGASSIDGNAALDANSTSDGRRFADAPILPVISRYGRQWNRYAIVTKSSDTRGALLEVAEMEKFRRTGVVPQGAVELLEVGDASLDNVSFLAYRVKNASGWTAGRVFPPDYANPSFVGAVDQLCEGCHATAASDTTFTLPSLMRYVNSGRTEMFTCAMPNFNPCSADVYATGG
jgi:hypothetical protein